MRRRVSWWTVAAVCGLIGVAQLRSGYAAIDTARAEWGETARVLVLTSPVRAGDALGDSVETRVVPVAMVPAAAALTLPPGALAKVDLFDGEVLLERRMTGGGSRALPAGSAAVTLQLLGAAPLIEAGDLVDIWMADSAAMTSRRVGRRLVVLARSESDLTVIVSESQVGDLAIASLRPVTAVLVG
jgi:hypothetical protein